MNLIIRSCSKFTNLSFAKQRSLSQKYWVSVLMGDDGLYWVPANSRHQSILEKAGYEAIPRNVLAMVD